MAASLGRLTLDLAVRLSSYTQGLNEAESRARRFSQNVDSAMSGVAAGATKAAGALVAMAGAYVSLNKLIEVQRNFDKLNAGLITATKSTENATAAFDALQKFAAQTPYSLDQAVEGFTKLVNLGLTPSERAMKAYGNTASAMGKDLMQMIEAVADASTGEFERLKEFGIKASKQGDEVAFTFQGTTTRVKNSASAIEEYLTKLGENQFAGAMQRRMDTLDGSLSNLEDNWNALYLAVSQAATGSVIKDGVDVANVALGTLTDLVKSGAIPAALAGMGKAFGIFGSDAKSDLESIAQAFNGLGDFMIEKWRTTLKEINAMGNVWTTMRALIQKGAIGFAAGIDIITDPFNKKSSNEAKQQAYEQSMAAIDNEAIGRWDAFSKGVTDAGKAWEDYQKKQAAAGKSTTDQLAKFKVAGKELTQEQLKQQEKQAEFMKKMNEMVGVSALQGLRISGGKAVDGGGVRGYTAAFAKMVQDALGGQLTRFTAFNDSFHKTGRHPLGQAFDFQIKDAAQSEQALNTAHALAKKYGFVIKTLDEYKHKSKNWTGPHLHVSVLGFKGGKEALDNAKAEAGLLGDVAKSAAEAVKQAEEEAKRRAEIQARYFTESQKRQAEHEQMMADIRKGGFSQSEQDRLLKQEEARYKREEALADAKYNKELADMWSFRQTERDQIDLRYKHELDIAQQSNDALKDERIKALKQQRDEELAALERRNQLQILDAQQGYGFETKLMLQKYAIERDEIIKNAKLDEQVKQAMLLKNERDRFAAQQAASGKIGQRGIDTAAALFQRQNPDGYAAWDLQNQYGEAMGGLQTDYNGAVEGINAKDPASGDYIIKSAQERYELLKQAEADFQQSKLDIQADFAQRGIDLENQRKLSQLDSYQSIFGSMTSIAADAFGKQSAAYRAAFAVEKGFAVAKAVMNMQVAMTEAAKLPFPLNLSQYATVAAQMASIIGTIKGVSAPTGMAHSGLDYIPREGTWLLDKGERVLSPRQNRDLTDYLSNRSQQGSNITINNHAGAEVTATQNPDGSVTIDVVRKMIDGKFRELNDPNSRPSKLIQRNFDTRVKR